MKKIVFGTLAFVLSISTTIYIAGCSSDDSSSSTTSGTTYSGPGSQWNVTLGSSTFTITYASEVGGTTEMTVNGTYETLSSGYLKLTVTSASGTDAPTAGAQAYAMNIPGFVFMLKPLDNDSEIIPMIVSGTCPTTQTDFNWMVTSHEASGQGASLATGRDLVGTASFNGSNTMTVSAKYDLGNNSLGSSPAMSGSCSNGIINLPDDDAAIWLSESGAALVQVTNDNGTPADPNDDRDGVIVAMPQASMGTMASLDGDYIGIVFNEAIDSNMESETKPVWLTMASAGTTEAGEWTDVDAGTKGAAGVTLSGFTADTPSAGFFTATLTDNGSGDTAPMTCQVSKNVNATTSDIIFCVGIDPDSHTNGAGDQLYTVLLMSTN